MIGVQEFPDKTQPEEWQLLLASLRTAFAGPSGQVAEEVTWLRGQESLAADSVRSSFGGFTLILDCFQSFVIRSLSRGQSGRIAHAPQLCAFVSLFRMLRSSFLTFWSGYYFEAASGLRGVQEGVLVLAAVANGYVPADQLLTGDRTLKDRAVKKLLGSSSGLTPEEQHALRDLNETLGLHVHGGQLVSTLLLGRLMEQGHMPTIEPYVDESHASHYSNLAICLSWAMLRILGAIPDRMGGDAWNQHFQLLDASLAGYVAGWDQPVARAFERWIQLQLSFSPVNHKPSND